MPAGAVTVDRDRLVETAGRMIDVHSFTGDEQGMAELMVDLYRSLGLQVQWQQVEDGRANAIGTWSGSGGGKTLMFNGHMDTSYSGREEWLRDVPGFQPEHFVEDGRLYGLGISNMKGALACYVEAVHALQDAGIRLKGDVMVAAVCGEIEKTQYGAAVGAEYRGYAAGSRYLVSHGGVADMCLLGEPTEGKVVLGHFGALWLRIRVHGNFIHTAFSEGKRSQNAILRLHEVLAVVQDWIPAWEDDPANAYRGAKAIVNVGAIEGGFGWRVSRTPHHADLFLDVRVPPTKPMGVARREVLEMVRGLAERFPDYGVEGRGVRHRTRRRDRRGARARGGDRRGPRRGARRGAGTGRDALVLGCLGADPLRHPDRQLRHVDRPDGRGARREPRDRGARADGRDLRPGSAASLRLRSRAGAVAEARVLGPLPTCPLTASRSGAARRRP